MLSYKEKIFQKKFFLYDFKKFIHWLKIIKDLQLKLSL